MLAPPPPRSSACCTDERATPHARPAQIPARASAPPRSARLVALAVVLFVSLLGPLIGHADGQCVPYATADLALVIDGSRSISPDEWDDVIDFLKQVVDRLPIGEFGVRAGLIACEQLNIACLHCPAQSTPYTAHRTIPAGYSANPPYTAICARARAHTHTHVNSW